MTQVTHTTSIGGQPTPSARVYQGWQIEKINFMFGLSTQRALMLGAAVLIATLPIAMSHVSGAVVAWPIALVLALLVFIRIVGRTTDEWAMAAVSYGAVRLRSQHKFLGAAFSPVRMHGKGSVPDLPGFLAPIRILVADMGNGRELAVAHNRHEQTYTAVAKVRFPGIGLVDSGRRDQRVAGWGSLISGLCTEGNPITRVQALQRLVPESGAELRRWHEDHISDDAPVLALDVSQQLLGAATVATSTREAYLAFTLDARRAAHAIKTAGGGSAAAANVLARHMRAVTGSVTSADLVIDEWLTPRDLAEVIRTAYDPESVRHLSERRAAAESSAATGRHVDGLPAGVDPGLSGPAAAQTNAGNYAHDGATSVTYWVYNWPKHQVPATCLAPLLGEGAHRRSFSMHIEPLSPRIAERDVMRERTARSVAVRMRERTGQIVPEHEKDALFRANEQDAERAAGHGLARFTGYVTVTVTDPDQLPDACAALEADAAAARIELRRMWFAQDIGFALSCLPLGFGLPRKRW